MSSCAKLKIANLSNLRLNASIESRTTFTGAQNLKILDLSNSDISGIGTSSLFASKTRMRYLNIKGASISLEILKAISGYLDPAINIICKDEAIELSKENSIYICCNFEAKTDICESLNYLKMYYETSQTFSRGFYGDRNERSEQEISFVLYNNSILLYNESFTVNDDSIVEIYFKTPLTSLSNYFFQDTMTSVDFSHFVTSDIMDINGAFKECESLKTIDLSYVKSSWVKNFESFCLNCFNLVSANLSHITTISIENIKSMFSQCSKLEAIDISGLNMENAESDSAFDGLNSLKYINIKDTTLSANNIEAIENLENNLTI